MQFGLHVVDWVSPLGGGGLLSLCLAASPYLLTSTLRSEVVHDLGAVVVQCQLKRGVAILREEMSALENEVNSKEELIQDARDYTKDIKNDLKDELHIMSKQVDDIEKRGKEAFRMVRDSIETNDTKVRKLVSDSSDRFDNRREQLRSDMDNLEQRLKAQMKELKDSISDQIKKALENPLAGMRKK